MGLIMSWKIQESNFERGGLFLKFKSEAGRWGSLGISRYVDKDNEMEKN